MTAVENTAEGTGAVLAGEDGVSLVLRPDTRSVQTGEWLAGVVVARIPEGHLALHVSFYRPGLRALLSAVIDFCELRTTSIRWRAEENWMDLDIERNRRGSVEVAVVVRQTASSEFSLGVRFASDQAYLRAFANGLSSLL